MQIRAAAAFLGRSLLDFVYPPHCAACETSLAVASELLCPACWQVITARHAERCGRCSCPLGSGDGAAEVPRGDRGFDGQSMTGAGAPGEAPVDGTCPNCATWDPDFERVLVLGAFDGPMQTAIHALKFGRHQRLGRELGQRLADSVDFAGDMRSLDLLVPVPLHAARQRERGYNQSLCIAEGMATALGIPVRTDLVRRRKATQQQARLEAEDRIENLRDAFEVIGDVPTSSRVAVVDDVVTTGATLNACAQVLQHEGSEGVWGAALASPFFLT